MCKNQPTQVIIIKSACFIDLQCAFCQQVQWPLVVPNLVLALGQSTWMVLVALAVKLTSLTALIAPVLAVPMGI